MKTLGSVALVAALVLAVAASAAEQRGPGVRVRTVATIAGPVTSFAHNDRYLAWIAWPKKTRCRVLVIQDLRTDKRTAIPDRCELGGGWPDKLVLAGDRAYWELDGASNLTEYTELSTASLSRPKVVGIDYQSIYNAGFDHIVPPASDGRHVYYWSSPEDVMPGPIYRYDRRAKSKRLTKTIPSLAALGAGEGRWAFARAPHARLRAGAYVVSGWTNCLCERREAGVSWGHLGRERRRPCDPSPDSVRAEPGLVTWR